MPARRSRFPLINELNEHALHYKEFVEEGWSADCRYALERAAMLIFGRCCTYLISAGEAGGSPGVERLARSVKS